VKPGRRKLAIIATSIAIHAVLLGLFVPSARTPQGPSPAPFITLVSTPPAPFEPPPPPPPVEEVFDDEDPIVVAPRLAPPPETASPPPSRPDESVVATGSLDLPAAADLDVKLRRPIRPRPPTRVPDPPPVITTTVVRTPTPIRRVTARLVRPSDAPAYPPARLDRGDEGEVRLRVEVLPDGRPGRIEALTPRAHSDFERAAIRWAGGLDYRPARVNGRAITSWVRLPPIRFRIRSSN